MNLPVSLGVVSGLASALIWGVGDFIGGLATRRSSPFAVVTLTGLAGVAIMTPAAILAGEPFPSVATIGWAVAAGLCGAAGVAALYQGLATGAAAVVAPTSAVIAAALPVVAGSLLEGLPPANDLVGIAVGLAGIWLVSRIPNDSAVAADGLWSSGLVLGLLAGAGFGTFFILIAQVDEGALFSPLVFSKLTALLFGLIVLMLQRRGLPSLRRNALALLSGVFDAGGNIFFLYSAQTTTLAVAAVLASMYPAVTVGLSAVVVHERVRLVQAAGVALCVAAVVLISL
jgi:drug/metabolite transporter (DMT)-like permease